jgi:2-oxoglutarate dehydrogenase E1 component
MVRPLRKPLIVFMPKSLLRHKESVSSMQDLSDGKFQPVIGDVDKLDAKKVRRIIICSGKVYFDLLAYRREKKITDTAVIRLEQQYPFPHDDFRAVVAKYPAAKEVVWCQEEPQNQGAWYRLRAYFRSDIAEKQALAYAGRAVSASPAVGQFSKHVEQQKQLVENAFANRLEFGEMVILR